MFSEKVGGGTASETPTDYGYIIAINECIPRNIYLPTWLGTVSWLMGDISCSSYERIELKVQVWLRYIMHR